MTPRAKTMSAIRGRERDAMLSSPFTSLNVPARRSGCELAVLAGAWFEKQDPSSETQGGMKIGYTVAETSPRTASSGSPGYWGAVVA